MRTVRQLDVGKDFLKQDHVCWFILNLSGFQPFCRTVFLFFLANLGVWFVGDLNHCGTPGFLQSAMRVAQCIAWSRNVGSINNIFCRNTSAKIVQVRCWNPTSCWSTWDEFLPSFWCFIRPSRDVCPWHCGGCASVWSCYNSQVGGSMCWNPLGGVWLLEG